jgi:hypothetical protein
VTAEMVATSRCQAAHLQHSRVRPLWPAAAFAVLLGEAALRPWRFQACPAREWNEAYAIWQKVPG